MHSKVEEDEDWNVFAMLFVCLCVYLCLHVFPFFKIQFHGTENGTLGWSQRFNFNFIAAPCLYVYKYMCLHRFSFFHIIDTISFRFQSG